jgi:hypothetical protein
VRAGFHALTAVVPLFSEILFLIRDFFRDGVLGSIFEAD